MDLDNHEAVNILEKHSIILFYMYQSSYTIYDEHKFVSNWFQKNYNMIGKFKNIANELHNNINNRILNLIFFKDILESSTFEELIIDLYKGL